MRINVRIAAAIAFAGIATWLTFTTPTRAQPPADAKTGPNGGKGKGKGGGFTQDPRAQSRTYHFADTNEDIPYSLYVSTKVKKDKKAPLVVTLHGLGSTPPIMMTKAAVDLAEEGGYILVAPMGYNSGGWYGSPVMDLSAGRGKGKGAPGGAKGGPVPTPSGDVARDAPVNTSENTAKAGPAAGKGGFGGFGGGNNPANLAELSEKDVMNVIEIVRKEYKVDDKRTYLMGHSMGGAGTLFLGSKHAKMWAAIAAEAPADFLMNNNRTEILQKIKDAKLPVMIVSGDIDEAVPVTNTRMWVETMKELKLDYEYVEQPGITHGPVIESGLKPIYAFFAKHKR